MLDRIAEGAFERERRFISEASHELRTPITICRGHLEVLRANAAPDEVERTVALVVDELARMGRIVDDLITLATVEQPAFLRSERIAVEPFLREVASKAAPLLNGRLQIGPVPERAVLEGDRQRLTQALLNLLQNAAVHGCDTSTVGLDVVAEQAWYRFTVTDDGGGLPAGEEDLMFQPFRRGDVARPGTGLGLPIVCAVAEAHGGSAGVENHPGHGATFWMRVPA
jgi:signal transduction histidine kinase